MGDEIEPVQEDSNFIPLTSEEKNHIYKPWRNSLIIKIVGRKVGHQLLKAEVNPSVEAHRRN